MAKFLYCIMGVRAITKIKRRKKRHVLIFYISIGDKLKKKSNWTVFIIALGAGVSLPMVLG